MNVEGGIQLRDLRAILDRRKRLVGAVAGLVFLASVVVAALLPNRYESWTTVLVEPQAVSARLVEAGLAGSDLNARLHLMTMQILSRARLSRIIDDFGLYSEESERLTREQVIDAMRKDIRVEPVLPEMQSQVRSRGNVEINTFRLFFRHDSPRSAAQVANRLANDFIEKHIEERVQISGDTSEFIESELGRLATRIRDIEARIAEVKTENAGRLPEDMAANQHMLERLFGEHSAAQRQLDLSRSDEAFYSQQAASFATGGGLGQIDSPARRLELLELDLARARARGYTDKHPDVLALETEIGDLRALLSASLARQEDEEQPFDAIYSTAEAQRRRAALQVAAGEKEIQRLRNQINEMQQRISETPRVAEQLSGFEREHEHLFRNYQEFSNKLQEASVAANMERRQKGEQFRVLEVAYAAPDPVSPNRPLILMMGVLLGLVMGVGVGVLVESTDTTFYEPRALQTAFEVPVLGAIPRILLDADRMAMRRRRMWASLATLAFTGVILTGAASGYILVNGAPGWLKGLVPDFGREVPAVVEAVRDRES